MTARRDGTAKIRLQSYFGENAEFLKYAINYHTGTGIQQAADFIRTGGTIAVQDADTFAKELKKWGVEFAVVS